MLKIKDLTGHTSGYLTVTKYIGKKTQPSGNKKSLWEAVCVCGVVKTYTSDSLSSCVTKSCGCKKGKKTHGKSKTATYGIYKQMIDRCYNPKSSGYLDYGGAGVVVCGRWLESDVGVLNFIEDMGERPEGLSLNRVNGARVYSKETCEWATLSVQAFDQKIRKSNKSGATGVRQIPSGKWVAEIDCNGRKYLGSFLTFEEAVNARRCAELKYFGWSKQR